MGVITLKLDDEVEEKLRRRAGRIRGASRGAISQSVEEAINLWLVTESEQLQRETRRGGTATAKQYVASTRNGKRVAQDYSLENLSIKLKETGKDPRDLVIESIPPEPAVRRMGLRLVSKRPRE